MYDPKKLSEDEQSKKLKAMFTNQIPNVPFGEDDEFDITEWDYTKEPPRPLTPKEMGKLTPEQQRECIIREVLKNLNNPENHDKST
jgi:hypothetical protein